MLSKSPRVIKRKIRASNGGSQSVTSLADCEPFPEIDAHIKRHATPDALLKAMLAHPETRPELAKRLRKKGTLRKHQWLALAQIARKAIFDIETLPSYIINERFEDAGVGRYRLHVSSTLLPWIEGTKEEKGNYLCFGLHKSLADLRCELKLLELPVDGEVRSVLVSGHVCERMAERSRIQGSHVAYIAYSVGRGEILIRRQPRGERLLIIYDLFRQDHVLGYCPIVERKCGLHRGREALQGLMARTIISDQWRWKLKTFLLPEYFEDVDGHLNARREKRHRTVQRSPLGDSN